MRSNARLARCQPFNPIVRMEHELHVSGHVAPGVSVVDGSAPLYWYRAPEHMFRYSTLGAEKTVERPPWRVFDK